MIKNFINGSSISYSSEKLSVYNPSTGEEINQVVSSDDTDFQNCIDSSKKAFLDWSSVTPLKRSRILSKYKNILEQNTDNLSKIISEEHGKTIEDAKGSFKRN